MTLPSLVMSYLLEPPREPSFAEQIVRAGLDLAGEVEAASELFLMVAPSDLPTPDDDNP